MGGCSKRGQTGQQYRCPGRLKNVSDRREFTAIFGLDPGTDNKVQISIRYHREVLDYFKAKGNGWQVQMDKVLLDWVRTHSTKES